MTKQKRVILGKTKTGGELETKLKVDVSSDTSGGWQGGVKSFQMK
jgi:hypothetical protein